jgi:methylmalonyl-CoA/ethylmalonyl-CoA epimerase
LKNPKENMEEQMSEAVKANFVDHISIAVKDVAKAEDKFKKAFGWEISGRYTDSGEKIRVSYFMVGPTAVEVMEDLDGTGEVAKFIAKHGEGVMVLSLNVPNCAAELKILEDNGADLIDHKPRFSKELNRHFAFLHPRTYGVLTEVIDGHY